MCALAAAGLLGWSDCSQSSSSPSAAVKDNNQWPSRQKWSHVTRDMWVWTCDVYLGFLLLLSGAHLHVNCSHLAYSSVKYIISNSLYMASAWKFHQYRQLCRHANCLYKWKSCRVSLWSSSVKTVPSASKILLWEYHLPERDYLPLCLAFADNTSGAVLSSNQPSLVVWCGLIQLLFLQLDVSTSLYPSSKITSLRSLMYIYLRNDDIMVRY